MISDILLRCRLRSAVLLSLIGVVMPAVSPAQADLIKLRSGGELRGRIDRDSSGPDDELVTIRTLSGLEVVVARKDIQFLTHRPLSIEEYESRLRRTPNTVEAQWELAEWCREQGLKTQREEQLERVIALDPDHEAAHRGLKHRLVDGEWMSRDEEMLSKGYVKHRNRYVTPQELELIEKTEADLEAEQAWYKKVRLWRAWLYGRSDKRREQALVELQQIVDPYAVAALTQNFQDDENRQARALFVKILSGIDGPRPVAPLVAQSLHDSDHEIRYEALNAISEAQYDFAIPLYVRELNHDWNEIIRRAAMALQRMGDESVVEPLIASLVTTHKYRVQVPRESVSMNSTGMVGNPGRVSLPPDVEARLLAGQLPYGVIVNQPQARVPMKTIVVKRQQQNSEVLTALQKITGESFGYDERTWQLWWSAKKSGALSGAKSP